MTDHPDPGPLPELAWLPVDKCSVDPRYQRSLEQPPSPKHVEKIAQNFRWARFQAVLATPREGGGWLVLDGQHRTAAARARGITHVPAVVLSDLAIADQADAFVWANRERVPVSPQSIFHAELSTGNPDAVTLDRLTRAAGVEIVRYRVASSQCPLGKVAPIGALRLILRKHGEERACRAIVAVVKAYGAHKGALSGNLFLA